MSKSHTEMVKHLLLEGQHDNEVPISAFDIDVFLFEKGVHGSVAYKVSKKWMELLIKAAEEETEHAG